MEIIDIVIDWILPFIAPALAINIILDIIKQSVTKRPRWLLPILCLIISIVVATIYIYYTSELNKGALNHAFGIMGTSFFFYSIGGYDFIKFKVIRDRKREGSE